MDLREAVERYANAVSSRDYWDNLIADPRTRKRELDIATSACEETGKLLDALIGMANAAVAYMEHQANPPEGGLTDTHAYFHKLAELGKAFMEARRKAEEACNSPAGEGET